MNIYADNAATTRMSKTAIDAMIPYMGEIYGNPSSLHTVGQKANEALQSARERVAKIFNCSAREILFTSGGSEADNQAIISAARIGEKKGKKHIISTAFEHHAVLHTLAKLEKEGFEVTLLDVHENGIVTPEEVAAAIRPDTCLVTIMYANNEIGSIQPIPEIGAVCREKGVLFHTDAVQAAGHLHIDVQAQNIDMLSLSAHKFHGPKGVGVLYAKKGIALTNIIEGGAQERGKRGGTENIAGIMSMTAALEEACANRGAGGDPPFHPERGPHEPSSQQRQLLLRRHRRRKPAAPAGRQGHLRFVRFRLHIRVSRSQPRAAGHRPGARRGPRKPAAEPGRRHHGRGDRLHDRGGHRRGNVPAKHVSRLERPAGRQERIRTQVGGNIYGTL